MSITTDTDGENRPSLRRPHRYRFDELPATASDGTSAEHELSTALDALAQRRTTGVVLRTLASNDVDTLVPRCRAEGVMVHDALAAAMLMAVGRRRFGQHLALIYAMRFIWQRVGSPTAC